MLVAAHITKRDTSHISAGDPLKVARTAPAIENGDLIQAGTNNMNGSFRHYQAIFIGAWSDKDVICWSGVV